MRSNLLLTALFLSGFVWAQPQGGFEQYSYLKHRENISINPIIHLQSKNNWYVEGRYNYEDYRTFSVYAGKVFSKQNKFSYSIIPILGAVFGKIDGGSLGLNANAEYCKFYFSTQSQCTLVQNKNESFYFSWTEVGFSATKWLYAGFTSQHTYMLKEQENWLDLGIVIGLCFGKLTIPIYGLNPLTNNQFFIVGLSWEWEKNETSGKPDIRL